MNGMRAAKAWSVKPIREVVYPKENWDSRRERRKSVQYLEISGIDSVSGTIVTTRPIESECPPSRAKRVIRTGDVVFGTTRPYLKNIAIIPDSLHKHVCSTGFCVLRVNPEFVMPEWLFAVCRSSLVLDQVIPVQDKSTYPAVSDDTILDAMIPVPLLEEQHRIILRIEALTSRLEKKREITTVREAELDSFVQSLYCNTLRDARWKPLKDVASLVRRPVKTKPDKEYEEMGIRSFGKGTFKKPILTGRQIGNKRIYSIHKGDLVFNNVFAWERAIAVAKDEDHGRVGSHRFITYVAHEGQATSEFLCHHFLSERGIEDIRAASPGSAGRNRTLGLKKLENILVPVPDYDKQRQFSEIARRRQLIQSEAARIEVEIKAFTPALLAKAFRGEV